MTILGIDPGLDGALALLDCRGKVIEIVDMPTVPVVINKKNRRIIDKVKLFQNIERLAPALCCLEQASVRQGEGALGAFTTGRGFGILEGILSALQIPTLIVTPQRWKRDLQVTSDKKTSRDLATKIFSEQASLFRRVKDADRAEACLIALYGIKNGVNKS